MASPRFAAYDSRLAERMQEAVNTLLRNHRKLETIRVRLSTLGNNSSTDIQLDFVTVNAVLPIPEPATAALALLGLPALLRRRQRLA